MLSSAQFTFCNKRTALYFTWLIAATQKIRAELTLDIEENIIWLCLDCNYVLMLIQGLQPANETILSNDSEICTETSSNDDCVWDERQVKIFPSNSSWSTYSINYVLCYKWRIVSECGSWRQIWRHSCAGIQSVAMLSGIATTNTCLRWETCWISYVKKRANSLRFHLFCVELWTLSLLVPAFGNRSSWLLFLFAL